MPAASRKVPHGRAEPLPIWCRVRRYAPEAAVRVSGLSSESAQEGRLSLRGGSRGAWPRGPAVGATAQSKKAAGCAPAPPPPGARAAVAPPAPAQTAPLPAAAAHRSSGTRGRLGLGAGSAEGWGPTPGPRGLWTGAAAWAERSWRQVRYVEGSGRPYAGRETVWRPRDSAGLNTLQWKR